jgi:rubrerythrin
MREVRIVEHKYKGISRERLTEIQKVRFPYAEPVSVEQQNVMKSMENDSVVSQVNAEIERMHRRLREDTEMSIVVEMAKEYLENMTPHEVKQVGDSWKCTACGIGFGHRFGFDFCPWCGKRMKW